MESENEIKANELHIEKINMAIDAIIDLEDYYPLPNDLSKALDKLNSLRSLAEEDISVGDKVYIPFLGKIKEVYQDGYLNWFFNPDIDKEYFAIGKKFCFKMHY